MFTAMCLLRPCIGYSDTSLMLIINNQDSALHDTTDIKTVISSGLPPLMSIPTFFALIANGDK